MAEYITNGQSNYGWSLTWDAAGRYPIVAKRRFATLADAQAFVDDISATATATEGLILSVINDSVAKNNGVYYIESVAMAEGETGKLVKVGGAETETAADYAAAVELSKTLVVGQLIKVENEYTENEGTEDEVTYQKGFYIVEAQGVISALATSTGSDDEMGALKGRVTSLETTVGNDEAGLVKDVADLKQAVEEIEIPEVPVKDVQVDGTSVLDENGVAVITIPDLKPYALAKDVETALAGKVDAVEGSRLMTDAEGTKLDGVAEGAQVNVIEAVKVNGSALEITDKAVNIEIEAPKVKGVDGADKMLSLTEAGEVKSELSIAYVKADASGDGKPYISLFGKGGTTLISNIDATDFIKDGMINSVELVDTAEGKKALRLTWNTDAGKEVVDVDVTGLLDYYYAGDGIAFNETERKFSVDLKEGERFLVVDAAGLGIDETALWAAADAKYDATGAAAQALVDAKAHTTTEIGKLAEVYDAKGAAEAAQGAAQTYADGLNTAMDTRVTALEGIDHDGFVKVDGYVAYSEAEKTKLAGIAEGAQVNVIETVKVNGVEATVADKVAEVTVTGADVALGADITSEEEVVYNKDTKLSSVLQGIQDSISVAVSGGLTGVVGGNGIEVSAVAANKQTISAKVSAAEGNLISVDENGLYAAMYYDGDDVE